MAPSGNGTITGQAAVAYLGIFMQSARPEHRGVDAARVSRDALRACRDRRTLRRLSLGARRVAVPVSRGVSSPVAVAAPREYRSTRRPGAARKRRTARAGRLPADSPASPQRGSYGLLEAV